MVNLGRTVQEQMPRLDLRGMLIDIFDELHGLLSVYDALRHAYDQLAADMSI
jgi:hypothetical protein